MPKKSERNTVSEAKPVNIIVNQKDDKVTVRFDQPLNFLVMEPVAAIRIGELLKEQGIAILRKEA